MPRTVESPERFYGTFNGSPPGIIRRELKSPLRVFPEIPSTPTSSQNSLKGRLQIPDSKSSSDEASSSTSIDTTVGGSSLFSESENDYVESLSQVEVAVDGQPIQSVPSHYHENGYSHPYNLAIRKRKWLKEVQNFKDKIAPKTAAMKGLSLRKGEIKEIRSWLIKASFLVFTLIFTIPALCYYNKEMKEITNEMQKHYRACIDKFRDLEHRIETHSKLNVNDKKQLINEIERELGLSKSLDFFSSLSGSLEWVKNLKNMAKVYPKEKDWNQFTDLEQAEFILHLKKKGAFDKHSRTTMHFVIDKFKPDLDSKPKNGNYVSEEEVWEAHMSSMIDACLDGRYGSDRKRVEKIVTAMIEKFKEKGLKPKYDPMPLLYQLWKAGLFEDHRFFMTCNLLEEQLGITRPYIIEIYNSIPSSKPNS